MESSTQTAVTERRPAGRHCARRHPPLRRARTRPSTPCAGLPRGRAGRPSRRHGPVRLRQVDADAHPRRARQADFGHRGRSPSTEITTLDDNKLTLLRREHIGFVFQFFNLLPMLTAEENIVLPLSIAGTKPEQGVVRRADREGRDRGPAQAPPVGALRGPAAARRDRALARLAPDASSSPTSRPATSTRRRAARSSTSCATRSRRSARRSSW